MSNTIREFPTVENTSREDNQNRKKEIFKSGSIRFMQQLQEKEQSKPQNLYRIHKCDTSRCLMKTIINNILLTEAILYSLIKRA